MPGLFAECHILSSAALGKAGLCRVLEIYYSAKIFTLGKSCFSRSDGMNAAGAPTIGFDLPLASVTMDENGTNIYSTVRSTEQI